MKELLFSCKAEKEALENVLAFNQIRKCDEGINKYNEEIKQLKEEVSLILDENGIENDYIELISKRKQELKDLDTGKSRLLELDKKINSNDEKINGFNVKIKELESDLESLKRIIFDSDDAKVIVETQTKVELNNKRLIDLYELVENLNNDNTTLLIEKEFIKNRSFESDFNTPEILKVEISNELQRLSLEFERVIRDLDLAVREDIEFCMKKINNREKEIAKYEDRKSSIISEYPDALDLDFDNEIDKLDNLFAELDECFDDCCSGDCCECHGCNHDECLEECESDCECECDVCNCDDDENCGCISAEDTEENKITTDMVKVESIEKPEIELNEVNEAEIANDIEEETYEDQVDEEEKYDDTEEVLVDDSNSFSTIGSVPYVFSEGESLESIAEKVYPSKNCWKAIYNYNKEEIDNYLTANGISNDEESIKTLAADKYLFAGIQLNIPTDANYKG